MEIVWTDVERYPESWQAKGRAAQSRTKYRCAIEIAMDRQLEQEQLTFGWGA